MKNRYIRYTLFCIPLIIASILAGCSDDKDINYLDDNAYPPPSVNITSSASLDEVIYANEETVTGVVESSNGLRDIYGTALRKVGDSYEEIDKDKRIPFRLDEFPKKLEFSINIPVSYEDVAAFKIVATDILTKECEQIIPINHIAGIPPKVTADPAEIATVEFNADVTVKAKITTTEGLKTVSYTLVQKSPYKELHTLTGISVSGEMEKDIQFTVNVDDENAEAVAIIVTDNKGVVTTAFVDIKKITGIPSGRASIFEDIEMAPEWENPSNPDQPYVFSVDGITVGGTVKNVLSLREISNSTGGSVDFMFANLWRNQTTFGRVANRGFAFVGAERILGGPVGRQKDESWLAPATKNLAYFKVITDDLVASMNLDDFFENTTGNWQTYETLDQLANYVPETANDKLVVQRINAGASGTCSIQIQDGTYIAFKRQTGGDFKYGIIKVIAAADDSGASSDGCKIDDVTTGGGANDYYTGSGLSGFNYTGVASLYGKKCKLKIIVQK